MTRLCPDCPPPVCPFRSRAQIFSLVTYTNISPEKNATSGRRLFLYRWGPAPFGAIARAIPQGPRGSDPASRSRRGRGALMLSQRAMVVWQDVASFVSLLVCSMIYYCAYVLLCIYHIISPDFASWSRSLSLSIYIYIYIHIYTYIHIHISDPGHPDREHLLRGGRQ